MRPLKKILFLCPYPISQSPSQRFRFEQYFDILKANGFSFKVQSFFGFSTWGVLYTDGNKWQKAIGVVRGFLYRLASFASLHKYDFIFIHRECAPIGPPVLEFIIAKVFRKKIIYDFDDAIWLPNTSKENKWVAWLKWHSKVNSICRWSYKVSCGNEYLCNYARQFCTDVVFNPTTIDTENLHNPAHHQKRTPEDVVTIGWTGTHSTLPYLSLLAPLLKSLEERFRGQIRLLVIADKSPDLPMPSFQFKRWSKETEIEDLMEIDVGLMPLANDAWANGKCGFKVLQYMALNIPAVASAVGVNSKIVVSGENGYLCDSPDEWNACLEKLIVNKTLRETLGRSGREKVIAGYSVSSNSSNFFSLFL